MPLLQNLGFIDFSASCEAVPFQGPEFLRESHSRYNRTVSKSSQPTAPTVGFVSLGCPKNLVDSEVMMGLLDRGGARLTSRPEEAEILVVNTCSFIDTAKQESVDTILEMARYKTEGRAKKLIVAGCLVERYRDEIRKNIPEVDAVVGTGELESILEAAGIARPAVAPSPFNILSGMQAAAVRSGREAGAGTHKVEFRPEGDLREKQGRFSREEWQGAAHMLPTYLYTEDTPRFISTGRTSAYIKIAEGCDHPCTFCVIPNLRGKFRSRRFESVVAEAQQLVAQRRPGDHSHRPGHHLLRRRPGPERRPRIAPRYAGKDRRPALAALPLCLSQPHHGQAARNHREARQHLQVSRRASSARIARCAQTHEARRGRGYLPQDSRKGSRRRSRNRAAHLLHRRLPRRVAPRLRSSGAVYWRREIRLARRLLLFA